MAIDSEINIKSEIKVPRGKVRLEIYGEKMIRKNVTSCGKNGRIYLPAEWIGSKVKIVKC